jgi:hypothetical protein
MLYGLNYLSVNRQTSPKLSTSPIGDIGGRIAEVQWVEILARSVRSFGGPSGSCVPGGRKAAKSAHAVVDRTRKIAPNKAVRPVFGY